MPNRQRGLTKRWSLHPALHDKVSLLLKRDNLHHYAFHMSDDEGSCIKTYDTNIMGRFVCHNPTCSAQGWSSKMVSITIRLYSGQQYNARVYHQRCASCETLSRPLLDKSYAERVAYRIKKWEGVDVDIPSYAAMKSKHPHHNELCEGCRAGHCQQADLIAAL